MRKRLFLAIAIAASIIGLRGATADPVHANDSLAVALAGQVSAKKEGAMEGVIVGAKKDGSTITVNVTTDEKGRYSFPASKLGPGRYALKIRAAGYDLDGPKEVNVLAEKPTTANLKLKPTENLGAQLTNAEWVLSVPGTEEQKRFLLGCNSCHTLERVMRSNHTAAEWVQVFQRMSLYAAGSTPLQPQMLAGGINSKPTRGLDPKANGDWLASINAR